MLPPAGGRNPCMKTARFSKVVEKSGDPVPHLVLTKPEEDPELRKAIKANRVMSVFQESVGHKADRGEVGFNAGINRQFLIFPKSLRAFGGKEIVGIKYELIKAKEVPKSQRVAPPKPPKAPKVKMPKQEEEMDAPPAPHISGEEHHQMAELKKKIRRARKILEAGKAVAAFNLLKEIVEEEL